MLRQFGNRLLHFITMPLRAFRAAVEWLVAVRSFTDLRRRDLAVVVVVTMMAVVGIKLRYSGYADVHTTEYFANAVPEAPPIEEAQNQVAQSIQSARSGLASLLEKPNEAPTKTPTGPGTKSLVRERSNAAATVVSHPRPAGTRPPRDRTLILPMPQIVAAPTGDPVAVAEVSEASTGHTAPPAKRPDTAESDLPEAATPEPESNPTAANPVIPPAAPAAATGSAEPAPIRTVPVTPVRLTGQIEVGEPATHEPSEIDAPGISKPKIRPAGSTPGQ